jgi:hypothetical protein
MSCHCSRRSSACELEWIGMNPGGSLQQGVYGGVPVFFVGLSASIANKEAAAPPKDCRRHNGA